MILHLSPGLWIGPCIFSPELWITLPFEGFFGLHTLLCREIPGYALL